MGKVKSGSHVEKNVARQEHREPQKRLKAQESIGLVNG